MSSLIYFFKGILTGFTRNLSTSLGSIITIFLFAFDHRHLPDGRSYHQQHRVVGRTKVSITAYVADDAEQSAIDAVV